MADFSTTIATNQANRAKTRDSGQSARSLQSVMQLAGADGSLSFTFEAGVATNDNFILFYNEDVDCYLIPESCRIADTGGSGDVQFIATLEKVDSAGTVTTISGTCTIDNNSAAFVRLADADPVVIEHGDYIQATIDLSASGDAATAGETIYFQIATAAINR